MYVNLSGNNEAEREVDTGEVVITTSRFTRTPQECTLKGIKN